jgi:hypothetical protein
MQNGRRFTGYGSGRLRDTMQKQIFRVGALSGPRFCQLLRGGYAAWGPHRRTQLNKTGRPRVSEIPLIQIKAT